MEGYPIRYEENEDNDTSKVEAGSSGIEAEVRFLCC